MRKDPVSDDYEADNAANKWSEQQSNQAEIGAEIDRRKNGDCMNNLFE